jgi:hypothetical protein
VSIGLGKLGKSQRRAAYCGAEQHYSDKVFRARKHKGIRATDAFIDSGANVVESNYSRILMSLRLTISLRALKLILVPGAYRPLEDQHYARLLCPMMQLATAYRSRSNHSPG